MNVWQCWVVAYSGPQPFSKGDEPRQGCPAGAQSQTMWVGIGMPSFIAQCCAVPPGKGGDQPCPTPHMPSVEPQAALQWLIVLLQTLPIISGLTIADVKAAGPAMCHTLGE